MFLKLKSPLAFFDLEATGLKIAEERIVEIAIIKLHPDGSEEIFESRVNPERPIPIETSLIHGIYDEDVKDSPTFKDLAEELNEFLKGCDLAGFNIMKFDLPMLVEEFLRAGVNFSVDKRKFVDAQRIFHLMEPRTLSAAHKFYCNEELENAHSALADTRATLNVLVEQVKKYENQTIKGRDGKMIEPVKNDMAELHKLAASNSYDWANRMVYNSKQQVVFNFGKYRNQEVLKVLQKDPSYYEWMMRGDFSLNTKQKLTELRVQAFNKR